MAFNPIVDEEKCVNVPLSLHSYLVLKKQYDVQAMEICTPYLSPWVPRIYPHFSHGKRELQVYKNYGQRPQTAGPFYDLL